MRKDQVKDRLGKQDVYQPANDEPCVSTGNPECPVSSAWILWYIRKNPRKNLMQAYKRGEELIQSLQKGDKNE